MGERYFKNKRKNIVSSKQNDIRKPKGTEMIRNVEVRESEPES